MISREDVKKAVVDSWARRLQVDDVVDAILALIQSTSEVPVQRDERSEKLGEQLDAMVAECNANHRIISRLEERAQNAEALAANLKRLENERAIELMHFKRDLATLRARVRELEDALEFARDVLIEEGLQDVVPATLRKIDRTLLTTSTKEAMPFMLPAPKPATPIPPDPRDAVVKAADDYERLWMKVHEMGGATRDDRVRIGHVRGHLFATVRALRTTEDR